MRKIACTFAVALMLGVTSAINIKTFLQKVEDTESIALPEIPDSAELEIDLPEVDLPEIDMHDDPFNLVQADLDDIDLNVDFGDLKISDDFFDCMDSDLHAKAPLAKHMDLEIPELKGHTVTSTSSSTGQKHVK